MLALGREVQRELDTVEALTATSARAWMLRPLEVMLVLRPRAPQIVEDRRVLAVKPVLAHAKVHRAHGDALAHPLDVGRRSAGGRPVRPIAVRAPEIALVGEPEPTEKRTTRHGPRRPFPARGGESWLT